MTYAGGGHPPALLLSGPQPQELSLTPLESQGPMIGMLPDEIFETQTIDLAPAARLLVFSDGVFEIDQPDGTMWRFEDFVASLRTIPAGQPLMDRLLQHVRTMRGADQLSDDFSIVQAEF